MKTGRKSAADIACIIAGAELAGAGHLIGMLRRAMRGELNMVVPQRDTVVPPVYRLVKEGRPVIALVGDDDYRPAGPGTWACASKLRAWAAFAIVHGAGATRDQYDMAAEMATHVGRLLLVETSSAAAQDWAGFLRQRPGLQFMGVLPSDGAHPVTPNRGAVH